MNYLYNFVLIAEKAAEVIDYMMIDQMGLMPPVQYELGGRDERAYLVASFDPLELGRNLKPYENQDVARRLSEALARLPVVITKRTGTRYVVVLSGRPKLPKVIEFPGFGARDMFRLGMGLKGEAVYHADKLRNVIIGAAQGAGKSNLLHLLMYQAWQFGWKLYLADPDGHTFNPDIWNKIADAPVASSPEDVNILLDRLSGEIADRVALFRQAAQGGIPPADIEAYNETGQGQAQPLQRIGLFLDEANTSLGDRRVFAKVADLLRRGRKWGLQIFLAGHEWHKENIPAEVNDMLQTRIALTVSTAESSQVVLRDARWGKWVLRKPEGVLRVGQYMPMQFYLVPEEMERRWLSGLSTPKPLPDDEYAIVTRSILEEDGKMTMGFLMDCGLSDTQARKLAERYEACGWLEKDPENKNARFVTDRLQALLATNSQTPQTATNPQIWPQTDHKQPQTPDMELDDGEG